MISITPVRLALVPVDSAAAVRLSAPNYDEFQSDREIWEMIRARPDNILRVTMAHCAVPSFEDVGEGDTPASLARASQNMASLKASDLVREVSDVLYVYEIMSPKRGGVRQIGLGGLATTAEIRTDAQPTGTIVRNEGIRESKARGRANLISATHALIGTVNNAVADEHGVFRTALEAHADQTPPDLEVTDEHGNRHRIWLLTEPGKVGRFQELLAAEPLAFVADGNHRSAAAAMLGCEHFLAVFFPASTMGISPYNRLVQDVTPLKDLSAALAPSFEVAAYDGESAFQPTRTHEIAVYGVTEGWLRLRPKAGTFDPADAGESIDHDIVQRRIFRDVLGITDARDGRLNFVGANKDAEWLQQEVDQGRATYALTLPAVTMAQFMDVCLQGKMMPPKSTWFEPKIRSGLVMALLD